MKPIERFAGAHAFLSNFWMTPVTYEGVTYRSVEHAYVAAKTLSLDERQRIAACETPGKAKQMGRQLTLRADWEAVRLDIMRDLIEQKFRQPYLASMLRSTGTSKIIEGNTWGDTFWGVCDGVGENHLGKLLMDKRRRLLQASPSQSDAELVRVIEGLVAGGAKITGTGILDKRLRDKLSQLQKVRATTPSKQGRTK